jgi:hypothetical protein
MGLQGLLELAEKKDIVSMIVNNLIEYGLQIALAKYKVDIIIMILILVAL